MKFRLIGFMIVFMFVCSLVVFGVDEADQYDLEGMTYKGKKTVGDVEYLVYVSTGDGSFYRFPASEYAEYGPFNDQTPKLATVSSTVKYHTFEGKTYVGNSYEGFIDDKFRVDVTELSNHNDFQFVESEDGKSQIRVGNKAYDVKYENGDDPITFGEESSKFSYQGGDKPLLAYTDEVGVYKKLIYPEGDSQVRVNDIPAYVADPTKPNSYTVTTKDGVDVVVRAETLNYKKGNSIRYNTQHISEYASLMSYVQSDYSVRSKDLFLTQNSEGDFENYKISMWSGSELFHEFGQDDDISITYLHYMKDDGTREKIRITYDSIAGSRTLNGYSIAGEYASGDGSKTDVTFNSDGSRTYTIHTREPGTGGDVVTTVTYDKDGQRKSVTSGEDTFNVLRTPEKTTLWLFDTGGEELIEMKNEPGYYTDGSSIYDASGTKLSKKKAGELGITLSATEKARYDTYEKARNAASVAQHKEMIERRNGYYGLDSKGERFFDKFLSFKGSMGRVSGMHGAFMSSDEMAQREADYMESMMGQYFTVEGISSQVCDAVEQIPLADGKGVGIVNLPGGSVRIGASIQGKKSYHTYSYDEETGEKDDEYLYKVTFSLSNPYQEGDSGGADNTWKYNLVLYDGAVRYWEEERTLEAGKREMFTRNNMITFYSQNDYTRICIEFSRAPRGMEGDTVCNTIVEEAGTVTGFTVPSFVGRYNQIVDGKGEDGEGGEGASAEPENAVNPNI